jgi:Zn-finger nucleic acid-binding protein
MSDAYREQTLLCPACAVALDARLLRDAEVDVCGRCKGIWMDWFDGELSEVAMQASPMSLPSAAIAAPTSTTCPHCRRPMVLQQYGANGPDLWRCGECAGAFVPRASFEALMEAVAASETPPQKEGEPGSPFARMLSVLRRLLHGGAGGAEKADATAEPET